MKFISIGKICGTHGLKGELKIAFTYNIDKVFEDYRYILFKDNLRVYSFRIEYYYEFNKLYIFKLLNIDDVDCAKKFIGTSVILPETLKNYLNGLSGIVQYNELIGFIVFDERNQYIGELNEFYDFNGNIVFKISVGNKYFLINNNREHILEINYSKKTITILRSGLVEHNI
jgi:16S rRNA processing protein RimM